MLAQRKFPCESGLQSVERMLDYCETHLDFGPDHKPKSNTLPRLSKKDKKLTQIRSAYGVGNRKQTSSLASLSMGFFIDYKSLPVEFKRKTTIDTIDVKKSSEEEEE